MYTANSARMRVFHIITLFLGILMTNYVLFMVLYPFRPSQRTSSLLSKPYLSFYVHFSHSSETVSLTILPMTFLNGKMHYIISFDMTNKEISTQKKLIALSMGMEFSASYILTHWHNFGHNHELLISLNPYSQFNITSTFTPTIW
jgi:hypothetical protein